MTPDAESRADVCSHLRLTFPSLEVIDDGWLVVPREAAPAVDYAVHHRLTREAVGVLKANGSTVRHPDVIVKGAAPMPAAIEIDGSVHASRSERTERRNEWYGIYGIPLLVIEDAEVAGDGMWRDEVDRFVLDEFPEVSE